MRIVTIRIYRILMLFRNGNLGLINEKGLAVFTVINRRGL
jgi:hypothetical protein